MDGKFESWLRGTIGKPWGKPLENWKTMGVFPWEKPWENLRISTKNTYINPLNDAFACHWEPDRGWNCLPPVEAPNYDLDASKTRQELFVFEDAEQSMNSITVQS